MNIRKEKRGLRAQTLVDRNSKFMNPSKSQFVYPAYKKIYFLVVYYLQEWYENKLTHGICCLRLCTYKELCYAKSK